MKQDITDRTAKTAEIKEKRYNIKDSRVEGFTLRVSPSGKKTMAAMIRDKNGRNRTITIGSYPEMTIKEGRERCKQICYALRYGQDEQTLTLTSRRVEKITFLELLNEVEPIFAATKKGWRPRSGAASRSYMRCTIECVFAQLLNQPISSLTEHDIADRANNYQPRRALPGKTTANGQVSRALAYLAPVFDWAAHRNKFAKLGAGRERKISAPNVRLVHDPAKSDNTITGKRERVLTQNELCAILPLLTYPAPKQLRRRNILPQKDYGPIALKFAFLTMARIGEIESARWRDVDFQNGVWTRKVKATEGGARTDELPLSNAALDLLRDLPGFALKNDDAYIFPNRDGGKQANWDRISKTIFAISGTSGWTRHDIRRTGATFLSELGVAVQTIDAILAHKNPLSKTGVSGSAGHYLVATRILNGTGDPKSVALDRLAEAYKLLLE